MQVNMVSSAAVADIPEGELVKAGDVPRGFAIESRTAASVSDREVELDGAQLRLLTAGLFLAPVPVMSSFGQGRFLCECGSGSSTLAHLDGDDRGWTYALYSREAETEPVMTRWRNAGRIRTIELLDTCGFGRPSGSAARRALGQIAAEGLPRTLPLRKLTTDEPADVSAPQPGLFELGRGVLTTEPEWLKVHAIQVLGDWPGEVNYEQTGQ